MIKLTKILFVTAVAIILSALIFTEDLNHYNRLPGNLPWSDAISYVSGGIEFTQTGRLTNWACRRPPQHLVNASILQSFDYDLRPLDQVLKIATVLVALLMGLLLLRLYSIEFAAVVLIACLYFAKKQFWSTPLSENIGFFWGTISFIFFQLYWHEKEKWWRLGISLGVMWLAMYARASAILVPVALLGLGIWLQQKDKRLKVCLRVLLVMLPFFILTTLTQKYLCPDVTNFGNAAPTLYGMAKGGVGWTQVYQDFPQLKGLSDQEQNKIIKIEFVKSLVNQPGQFVKSYFGLLGKFLLTPEILGRKSFDLILFVFAMFVAIRQWRKKSDKGSLVPIGIFLAVLITAPLLYDGAARVYAPVVAFMAFMMAWPVWVLWPSKWRIQTFHVNLKWIEILTVLLLVISILSPLFVSQNAVPQVKDAQAISCPSGSEFLHALVLQGAQVQIGLDTMGGQDTKDSFASYVSKEEWLAGIRGAGQEDALFTSTQDANWFTLAIRLDNFSPLFLVHQKNKSGLPWKKTQIFSGCMQPRADSIYYFEPASQD